MIKPPSSRKRNAKDQNLQPLWETEARSGPKMEARAHILEAAAKAFMERGFSATTLDHVAGHLGTTKGQIYHYYRSKVDLYLDVVVGAFFFINDQVGPIARSKEPNALETLRQVAYAYSMVVMRTFSFQRVALEATQHQLTSQLSNRQNRAIERILRFRDEFEATVSEIILSGVRSGEFSVSSAPIAAKGVLGSLNWLTVWFDPKRTVSDAGHEKIAKAIADFVVAGLSPKTVER